MAYLDNVLGSGVGVFRRSLSRRAVLASGAIASVASLVRWHPARVDLAELSAAEGDAVLAIARFGAVYPIEFPRFGESGRAVDRATAGRRDAAFATLAVDRRLAVRRGAQQLLNAGAITSDVAVLRTALAAAASHDAVRAAAALAIATVSTSFDPNSDRAARLWLDGLNRMERSDLLTVAVRNGASA